MAAALRCTKQNQPVRVTLLLSSLLQNAEVKQAFLGDFCSPFNIVIQCILDRNFFHCSVKCYNFLGHAIVFLIRQTAMLLCCFTLALIGPGKGFQTERGQTDLQRETECELTGPVC